MNNSNYWFYLEPDVFIFKKNENVLLYNSLSKEIIKIQPFAQILSLIDMFLDEENLYVIPLSSGDFNDQHINDFVKTVRQSYFGDIIPRGEGTKPVLIPPILKLHKSKEAASKDPSINIGEKILSNLCEVTLQVNGECRHSCMFCEKMYRQFDFCTKGTNELDFEDVKKIITQINNSYCKRLIITGGNIFKYSHLDKLIELISQMNEIKIEFCFHYLNFDAAILSSLINNKIDFTVYFTFPVDLIAFEQLFLPTYHVTNITYIFVVQGEDEIETTQQITDDHHLENVIIKPFYDNNNAFFEQNVFSEKADIENALPNKQEIYARQSFNTYDFGKLVINNKGEIRTNSNFPLIGTINDNITDVILKEFNEGQSWFRIRDQPPCNNCVYQWLCPSPSNYELMIGKPNLCHIING